MTILGADGSVTRDHAYVGRFPVPTLDELPDDVRARIEAVQEKAGFVPNVYLALARRPDEFRAFFAYYDAVMDRDGELTREEKEMIVVATSAVNHCIYCVVVHGAILRVYTKDPLIAEEIAVNYRKAPITARQRAILDFAVKVATASHEVEEDDYVRLTEYGLSNEDVWDVAAITALFGLSNRMMNVLDVRPNVQFYTMGR